MPKVTKTSAGKSCKSRNQKVKARRRGDSQALSNAAFEEEQLKAFLSSVAPSPYHLLSTGYYEDIVGCTWEDIEDALDTCRGFDETGQVDRACILELGTTYVQTAFQLVRGKPAWRLEWRVTENDGSFRHCYAVLKTEKDPDMDMVFDVNVVKRAFHVFFTTDGRTMPTDELVWHEMDFDK